MTDPAAVLDGLTWLREIRDGTRPLDPFAESLGFRLTVAEHGSVLLEAEVRDTSVNFAGIAHGGFLSAILDLACGLALHTVLPAGRGCVHAQASYRFIRPARLGQQLRCTGTVVHCGRTLAVTTSELRDADDRLLTTGEATHALLTVA